VTPIPPERSSSRCPSTPAGNAKVAALVAHTLNATGLKLDEAQRGRALTHLRCVDWLEWSTVKLLHAIGSQDPEAVLELLLDRVDAARSRSSFDAVPWEPFDFDVLAGADDERYVEMLQRVRERQLDDDSMTRMVNPSLFWHLDRNVDLSLRTLHEWLTCDDLGKITAASELITGIAPGHFSRHHGDADEGWSELLARPWLIVDVLEHVRERSPETQAAARAGFARILLSSDVNRTLGEPDERSRRSHEEASRLMKILPRDAAARAFFADVVEHTSRAMEDERLDGEEHPHRLR
jgi:hypothetical protein